MVPDDSKSIRDRAIAAWPPAWHGGNLRDMLISLGYDVDRPWRELPKKARDWILFTDEQPVVPVYIGYDSDEARRAIKRKEEPSYRGNFSSARRYVLNTFATTETPSIKKRVSQYMVSTECPLCHGKRLRRESLSVKFAGMDIAGLSRLPLSRLAELLHPYAEATAPGIAKLAREHPEKVVVVERIAGDLGARLAVLLDLDVLVNPLGEFAFGAVHTDLVGLDRDGHARRHRNWLSADSRHRSAHQTCARTSPPTPAERAS